MADKESITLAEWSPLVDITEDDKEYRIKAELPEIKKEEIKFTVENGVLVISGERKLEKEEKGRKLSRRGACLWQLRAQLQSAG
jgi:HSP20 family protein